MIQTCHLYFLLPLVDKYKFDYFCLNEKLQESTITIIPTTTCIKNSFVLNQYLLYISNRVIASSFDSNVTEKRSHSKWTITIFYINFINLKRIYAGNLDVFQSRYQIWSQVIKSLPQTCINFWIRLITRQYILSCKINFSSLTLTSFSYDIKLQFIK